MLQVLKCVHNLKKDLLNRRQGMELTDEICEQKHCHVPAYCMHSNTCDVTCRQCYMSVCIVYILYIVKRVHLFEHMNFCKFVVHKPTEAVSNYITCTDTSKNSTYQRKIQVNSSPKAGYNPANVKIEIYKSLEFDVSLLLTLFVGHHILYSTEFL